MKKDIFHPICHYCCISNKQKCRILKKLNKLFYFSDWVKTWSQPRKDGNLQTLWNASPFMTTFKILQLLLVSNPKLLQSTCTIFYPLFGWERITILQINIYWGRKPNSFFMWQGTGHSYHTCRKVQQSIRWYHLLEEIRIFCEL